MSEDANLKAKVSLEGDDSKLSGVLNALADIADRSREAAQGLTEIAKISERAERSLAGVGTEAKQAAGALSDGKLSAASQQVDEVARSYAELSVNIQASQEAYKKFAMGQVTGVGGGMGREQFNDEWLDTMVAARKAASADLVSVRQKELSDEEKFLNAVAQSHTKNAQKRIADDLNDYKNQKKSAFDASQDAIKSAQERNKAEVTASKNTRTEELANLKAVIQARSAANKQAVQEAQNLAKVTEQNRAKELANMRSHIMGGGSSLGGSFDLSQFRGQLKMSYADIDVMNDKLSNTRYALHDISMTMAITGAAMIAGVGVFVKSAADYETAIANIQRTSEMNSAQAAQIRDDFVSLAQEIPAAFTDIAKVGELAGQLNVPAQKIAKFSETVLQFSATTNVTAESAATAMGRLDALLPDVRGNYDALGSSILKVGINSVATEQEIISTTSQIAAAGAMAGLTASQVIGLSASFASLGIAPEAARGTVVRVLGQMNKAIAQGGAALDEFADIADMSAKDFESTWGTSAFGDTFLSFLGGIEREGSKAQLALSDLGISAVRDQNNLLKLGQNSELVGQALADAATGFSDAGMLADSFAIKADTLNSRVQVLMNTLQAFAAESGEAGAGALGVLVEALSDIIAGATKFVQIPFVQTLLAVSGAFIAVVGAVTLGGAAMVRFAASGLAVPNVVRQVSAMLEVASNRFTVYSRAAIVAGTANNRFTATAAGLKGALMGVTGALKAVTGTVVPLLALTVAVEAFSAVANEMKSPLDKAKEAFGDFSSLAQASASDLAAAEKQYGSLAEAVANSDGKFSSVTVAIKDGNAELVESKVASKLAAEGQADLANEVDVATAAIARQTIALGGNYRAALTEALMSVDGFKTQFLALQEIDPIAAEGYLTALVKGDAAGAQLIIDEFQTNYALTATEQAGGAYTDAAAEATAAASLIAGVLTNAISIARGAIEGQAVDAAIAASTNKILGDSASELGAAYNDAGEQISASGEVIASANEVVANSFDYLTTLQSSASAMADIAGVFYGVSDSLDQMGSAAIMNADTLLKAVQTSIASGQTMGVSATDSVSAMFLALQQQGINTAALLASLSGMGVKAIGGVQLKDVSKALSGQRELTNGGKALTSTLSSMAVAGKKASSAIGGTGGAAKEAKQEIRTLTDYASDLSKVWSRAFEIRFSGGQGADKIVTSFRDIAKTVEAANKKIADYQQKLRELAADAQSLESQRSVTEYFLMVANAYGDVLRAGELSAKLADIDAKISKNKLDAVEAAKNLAEAQDETNMSLVGNSNAAIRNRADILALVQQYQSYISALASSGMEQGQLQAMTQSMKADFIAQATQLGYNSTELGVYAAAFDDVTTAINLIPRDITVAANTNPAQQAFNEMKAATDRASAAVSGLRNNIGQGVGSLPAIDTYGVRQQAMQERLASATALLAKFRRAGDWGNMRDQDNFVEILRRQLASGSFASGGFTGRGGKYEEAGTVHKGEYVIPKQGVDQSTGLPNIAWMMRNVMNTQGGGNSAQRINNLTTINNSSQQTGNNGVTEVALTPGSVQAVANAVRPVLNIGDELIAGAANRANALANSAGSN